MKQSPPPAKNVGSRIVTTLLALSLFGLGVSACATRPRSSLPAIQTAVQPQPKSANAQTASQININTAGVAELEKLPGVGPSIAERIIAHRQQYGPFRRAEHLLMVRGISDRKFRELRPIIVVD